MKKIGIIGVGLIGGSMAMDIRNFWQDSTIYGVDSNEQHLKEAQELGVIDHIASLDALQDAFMIILAIPVDKAIGLLPQLLDQVSDDTLVLDMGSTKAGICAAVAHHKNRRNFMACHPIAGTEFSGPKAAHLGLYAGKTNIICEIEKTAFTLQERALALFAGIGMRIRYMNAAAHDKHIAYVSHLSHISSFMLGKTVIDKEKNERDIFDMAGSGFASTVRLAKSNPITWTSIFKQNKTNILETLDEYIHNLEHFKQLMQTDDFEGVHQEMTETNRIKKILEGID